MFTEVLACRYLALYRFKYFPLDRKVGRPDTPRNDQEFIHNGLFLRSCAHENFVVWGGVLYNICSCAGIFVTQKLVLRLDIKPVHMVHCIHNNFMYRHKVNNEVYMIYVCAVT